jgi:hypothetical protein
MTRGARTSPWGEWPRRDPRTRALGLLCAVGAVPLLAASPVVEPKLLGTFEKWSAYAVQAPKGKHCFVYGEPADQKGKYKTRGKVSVTVSHRPTDKVRNEVSFSAGYSFKPESQLEVVIDGSKKFLLFVDGGSAWAPDVQTDQDLRKAIVSGKKMVVSGSSSRGTKTVDTYSLSGTKAALERIDQECP